MAMAPSSIVKDFNIVEDILPCLIAGAISLRSNSLPLEQREEALGNRVVTAVSKRTHTLLQEYLSRKSRQSKTPSRLQGIECEVHTTGVAVPSTDPEIELNGCQTLLIRKITSE